MENPYPHFVVHIPHSSLYIPEEERKTFLL